MIEINGHKIGPGWPCYIIAELSANHAGKLDIALASINAAKEAGANAIKLQTFEPASLTMDLEREEFKANPDSPWKGRKLFDLYKETMLPREWHAPIFMQARELDLDCFSSPFDLQAVDFLEELDCPAYKIASFEITDIPLIQKCASTGKPVIISTGIATKQDIELALKTCREMNNNHIVLLKCTSAYPTPPEEADLLMIKDMAEKFGVMTGLSDHTLGTEAASIAVSLGAVMIEKHFKLNDKIISADAGFSLNKEEFKKMVDHVRLTEKMLGTVDYGMNPKKEERRKRCRSLYISKDVKKGEIINDNNIRSIRPGNGLHPKYYKEILGKTFNDNFKAGTPLDNNMIT